MKHNAKRILSMVLCVLMCVSMLTGIVLPAAATETPEAPTCSVCGKAKDADPYAVLHENCTQDGNVYVPNENVAFFNPAWATSISGGTDPKTEGQVFEYTYGNGKTWGDGITYRLRFVLDDQLKENGAYVNTGNAFWRAENECIQGRLISAHSKKWADDDDTTGNVSRDIIAVFAPGNHMAQGYRYAWSKAHKSTSGTFSDSVFPEATQDEVVNLHYLGPQAGKNPVNPDKTTKANAKDVQNKRSLDTTTEAVFNDFFYFASYANMTVDGIAATKNFTLCAEYEATSRRGVYCNFVGKNIYLAGKTGNATAPYGSDKSTEFINLKNPKNLLLEFDDCYFDLSAEMNVPNSFSNYVYANKFVLDNCVFSDAKVHNKVDIDENGNEMPTPSYATHQMIIYPLAAENATDFCGENKEAPLFEVKNSTFADWEGCTILRFNVDTDTYKGYDENVSINLTDNYFYDVSKTQSTHGMPIYFYGVSTKEAQLRYKANITGNLFSFIGEDFLKRKNIEIEAITMSGASLNDKVQPNVTIKNNILKAPNHNNGNTDGKNNGKFGISLINSNWHTDDHNNIDVSDNLFMDKEGNIQPFLTYDNVVLGETLMHGPNVNSDIYADEQMEAGVRELMTVTEVKNGVAAYCYIQLRAQARYRNFDYFTGALTLLLKDGRKYDADTLIKTSCDEVEYLGIYEDEACTKKVEVITNDTVNGKFAKLQYKTATTTLTVVYALNTPENILVVTHPNSFGHYNYSYEFNGETYTNGVNAEFFTSLESAVAAAEEPYKGDLLDKMSNQMYPHKTTNGLRDLIVMIPNEYTVGKLEISKSVAIVGPQWGVSPYGSYEDAPANGRKAVYEEDKNSGDVITFEAVIRGTVAPEGAYSFVLDGVAFAGDTKAVDFSREKTTTNGAILQYNVIKNCVFDNSVATVIDGEHSENNPKVLNITFKDNTFINRTTIDYAQNLINYRAEFSAIENIAIFGLDCQVVKDNGGLPESETIVQNGFAEPKQSIQNIYYHVYHTDTNTERESSAKVDPTCVSYGSVDKLCDNCQSLGGFVEILAPDPTKHTNPVTNVDAKDATCGADGYTGDTVCFDCCLVLTEEEDKVIPATGQHTWEVTENIPATPSENGLRKEECTVCHKVMETELPFTGVAKIGDKIYSDLNVALDTAANTVAESETQITVTVTLIVADHTVDYIAVKPGVTLDLDGKTLRANYVIGFKDSAIVGKNSKIYIAKENVALDKQSTKDFLPVYYSNKGYYKFISAPSGKIQEVVKQYITEGTIYYFLPNGLQTAKSALLAGTENSGVKVIVRLSWYKDKEVKTENGTETVRNYTATQDYVYSDATVNEVINSYQNGSYASLFTAKFAGTEADSEAVSGLKVRAMLVSETGVEIMSSGISFTSDLNSNPNTDSADPEGETDDPTTNS